jgi:hypothetical protein
MLMWGKAADPGHKIKKGTVYEHTWKGRKYFLTFLEPRGGKSDVLMKLEGQDFVEPESQTWEAVLQDFLSQQALAEAMAS